MLRSPTAISGPKVSRPPVPSSKSERENLCRNLLLGGDVGTGSKEPSLEDGNCNVSASDVVECCSSSIKETGDLKFICWVAVIGCWDEIGVSGREWFVGELKAILVVFLCASDQYVMLRKTVKRCGTGSCWKNCSSKIGWKLESVKNDSYNLWEGVTVVVGLCRQRRTKCLGFEESWVPPAYAGALGMSWSGEKASSKGY